MYFIAIGVAIFFVVLVALAVYYQANPPENTKPNITYILKPEKTDLKIGEVVLVPVYLDGVGATKVTAFDIKLYYDATKFKLTNTSPGGFFPKYVTIKWDEANTWFALALTPASPKLTSQINSPLLTLELTAIAPSKSTVLSSGTSTLYITKMGGLQPKSNSVNFSIN